MDSDASSSASTSSSSSSASSSASSNSSDDEVLDLIAAAPARRALRIFRVRNCPYEMFSETQFKMRFRLSKATVQRLLEIVGPQLEHPTRRNQPISALNQIIITLRFLCTGSFQIFIGDDMRIHKSTVCMIVKKVVRVIAGLKKRYINMPRNEIEIAASKSKFRAIHGFPSVIGCVDGTHVRIQSPGGDNAELYRNRKGYFSYNVQAVCDADLRILSIDARWPGSTHDSTVFNASLLRVRFEEGEFKNCFLLGDSAYRSTNYMLTPILNPVTRADENYNAAQIHTRNSIERMFGVWKRLFPALAVGLRNIRTTKLAAIVAAAVLYNMGIAEGDVIPDRILDREAPNEDVPENPVRGNDYEIHQGQELRAALVNSVFHVPF